MSLKGAPARVPPRHLLFLHQEANSWPERILASCITYVEM